MEQYNSRKMMIFALKIFSLLFLLVFLE